jgi:hypothetical protein
MTGMPAGRVGLELGQHLDAIHDRHRDVEQDQVGHLLRGDGEALDAVAASMIRSRSP